MKIGAILAVALLGVSQAGCGIIWPPYRVWEQKQNGLAKLAEANSSKMIAVQQSKAKWEAAQYEKQAEIIRAQGAAAAVEITGASLQKYPEYLRYLYVNNLAESHDQIIYIPTEAGLPILEAGRTVHTPAPDSK